MSKEKQIEEMANTYYEAMLKARGTLGSMNEGAPKWYAKAFYEAGYRKQSEGEWIYHDCVHSFDGLMSGYACSCCSTFIFDDIYEDTSYPKNFCPGCGAKMKGE